MLKWVESFNKTVSRRTYLQSCQHTEPDTQGDGNVPVLRLGHSHRLLQSQPLLTVQHFNSSHKDKMRRAASETLANAVGFKLLNLLVKFVQFQLFNLWTKSIKIMFVLVQPTKTVKAYKFKLIYG